MTGLYIVKQLMSRDLYNGWGIHTLSSHDRGYNLLSIITGRYGHDNSLIAEGFIKYGYRDEANRIITNLWKLLNILTAGSLRYLQATGTEVDFQCRIRLVHTSGGCCCMLFLRLILGLEPDRKARV